MYLYLESNEGLTCSHWKQIRVNRLSKFRSWEIHTHFPLETFHSPSCAPQSSNRHPFPPSLLSSSENLFFCFIHGNIRTGRQIILYAGYWKGPDLVLWPHSSCSSWEDEVVRIWRIPKLARLVDNSPNTVTQPLHLPRVSSATVYCLRGGTVVQ